MYTKTVIFISKFEFVTTAFENFVFIEVKQNFFYLFTQLENETTLARQIHKGNQNHYKGFKNE